MILTRHPQLVSGKLKSLFSRSILELSYLGSQPPKEDQILRLCCSILGYLLLHFNHPVSTLVSCYLVSICRLSCHLNNLQAFARLDPMLFGLLFLYDHSRFILGFQANLRSINKCFYSFQQRRHNYCFTILSLTPQKLGLTCYGQTLQHPYTKECPRQ